MRSILRRKLIQGAVVMMALAGPAYRAGADNDPGARKRVGAAGAWKGTVAGAAVKNRLYTVDKTGVLYRTDLPAGKRQRVGTATFLKPRLFVAAGQSLYTVLGDNSLYRINPATGAKQRLGKGGEWKDTIAGAGLGGKLYTVENSGALWQTNPADVSWTQLGKSEFGGTKMVLNRDKGQYVDPGLFMVAGDGSLYSVNLATGARKLVGTAGAWKGSKAAAIGMDILYVVNDKGVLNSMPLSMEGGKPDPMGKPAFGNTKNLFVAWDGTMPVLYALDADGSLYSVEMAPMAG